MLHPRDLFAFGMLMLLPRRRLVYLVLLHRRENALLLRRRRKPVKTTFAERFWIVMIARLLGQSVARRHINIVSPDTLVRWMKEIASSLWILKSWWGKMKAAYLRWRGLLPKLGRPRLRRELVEAVKRIARENPRYGIDKIRGEMFMLDLPVSREMIRRILRKYFPDRVVRAQEGITYKQLFFGLHEGFQAMDFFSLISQFGQQVFCFFMIDHSTRKCFHFAATTSPSPEWVMGEIRRAYAAGHPVAESLISDNDGNFSRWFSKKLEEETGMVHHRTTIKSPWENGVAERFVRSVRADVFDRLPPVLGSGHAERIMAEYLLFYNHYRTHLTLDMNTPAGRARQSRSSPADSIETVRLFHGFWKFYRWRDSAAFC